MKPSLKWCPGGTATLCSVAALPLGWCPPGSVLRSSMGMVIAASDVHYLGKGGAPPNHCHTVGRRHRHFIQRAREPRVVIRQGAATLCPVPLLYFFREGVSSGLVTALLGRCHRHCVWCPSRW
jgi:hypothetical protein